MIKKTILSVILSLSILLIPGFAGAEWSKIYGTPYSDSAYSIRATDDGGYIVAGGYEFDVIKLYVNGSIEWQKSFTIESFDHAMCVQPTAEGGYILTGISDLNYLNQKLWVLKLNTAGTPEWQNTYESEDNSRTGGFDIQQTVDSDNNPDGYIVAGTHGGGISVLRLNLDGSLVWQKKYSHSTAGSRSIQQTFDADGDPNGFILGGSNEYYLKHAWVIKLDPDGDIEWEKIYGGEPQTVNCIRQVSGGGYIVVGESNTTFSAPGNVWVAKLAVDGAIVWQRSYGGEERDVGFEVLESRDAQNNPDGFVVTGFTESFGAGQKDVWVFKVNDDGNMLWQKTFGGTGDDVAHSLAKAHQSGYVIAGYTWSFGVAQDSWILQINETGEIPYCQAMGDSAANVSIPDLYFYDPYTPVVTTLDPIVTETAATAVVGGYVMTPMCSLAGDLNLDDVVDESDLVNFVPDIGRSDCTPGEPCEGDIDSDSDVDGKDLSNMAETYGESN